MQILRQRSGMTAIEKNIKEKGTGSSNSWCRLRVEYFADSLQDLGFLVLTKIPSIVNHSCISLTKVMGYCNSARPRLRRHTDDTVAYSAHSQHYILTRSNQIMDA